MSRKIKNLNLKILMGLLVLVLTGSYSYSRVWGNYSDCALEPGCESEGEVAGTQGSIGTALDSGGSAGMYIVEGAGYLLTSYSGMATFLSRVETAELTGTEYSGLREILYRTIIDMEKAKNAVYLLKLTADRTPYHKPVIERLLMFDYAGFQQKRNLNADIFSGVGGFLSVGDVRGLYGKCLKDMDKILDQLYRLKSVVEADRFPEISSLWSLNHDYATLMLFGQYTSQVFESLL